MSDLKRLSEGEPNYDDWLFELESLESEKEELE